MSSRKICPMSNCAVNRSALCVRNALIAGSFSLTLGGNDESGNKNRRRRTEGVAQRRRRRKGLNNQLDYPATLESLGACFTAWITGRFPNNIFGVGNHGCRCGNGRFAGITTSHKQIHPVCRTLSDTANSARASFAGS